MGEKRIVTGQRIDAKKLARARELRKNMTPAERRLWSRLRANRLNGWHFRRQQIIAGFIVDFYCHKAGLGIEVDSPIHTQQKTEDAAREEALVEQGLKILRFSNREVMNNLNSVLQKITNQLESNPPSLNPSCTGAEGVRG